MTGGDGLAAIRQRTQAALASCLADHVARTGWSRERVRAHQTHALRRLLAHARSHAPFHAERLAGIDPARFELADLPSLPVMTKREMMARFDDVVTDRRIDHRVVAAAVAAGATRPHAMFDDYLALTSGGSSGDRGTFVIAIDALAEFIALLIRASPVGAALAASTVAPGTVIAMIAAASAIHATGMLPQLMAGGPITWVTAPVTLSLAEMIARLEAARPDQLIGYPGVLARLARERSAGRLRISPAAITATAETLTPEHRAAIRSGFGVEPANTFGSSEGLVGAAAPGSEVLTFASDACVVELVDAAGDPVAPGVASARVLVTNLYNRVQPLIRYELADVFTRMPDGDHGHLRAIVAGRSDEVLRYGALELHPHLLRSVLLQVPEIADYQIHQRPRGVDVRVVAHDLDVRPLRAALVGALESAGLEDPEVRVAAVPDLERNGETGKLRRLIPL